MSKKTTKSCSFMEGYIINYDYEKDDGYWSFGNKVDVYVPITSNMRIKCNHERAERIFKETHRTMKNLKVNSVTYI